MLELLMRQEDPIISDHDKTKRCVAVNCYDEDWRAHDHLFRLMASFLEIIKHTC